MYQYRIFTQCGLLIKRLVLVFGLIVALIAVNQLAKLYVLIHRYNDIAGYVYLGMIFLLALYGFVRVSHARKDHGFLTARGFNFHGEPGHAKLKSYVRYLVHYIKRLSNHRLLTDAQASSIHQKALDIQEALHHHPLNDDLLRAIATARDEVIAPTFGTLGEIADKVTLSKSKAVIQDIYLPPFPIVAPLVVAYHQITLISEITDIYISRPSLREYWRVIADVWHVMTKGDFMRYGQRLFSGINSNTHSLGRPGDDLGQALSVIWLTHAISLAATNRCCTLHDWNLRDGIDDMQKRLIICLEKTRHALLNDAMPILKKRIRHYAPIDHDPNVFVDNIVTSYVKSVDSVVIALTNSNRYSPQSTTSPGLVAGETPIPPREPPAAPSASAGSSHARHGVRRRRRRRSRPRTFNPGGTLIQRFIYLVLRPKY